jgi:hypothetical protein
LPFNKPAFLKIAVLALDTDGDGAADAVQVTPRKAGPRKRMVAKIMTL